MNKLSGGQQRRLDVAIALAGDPELLFLDEPTTGFDPSARRNAWHLLRNLTSLGKPIWLTTHFMDEAQYLAQRVAVIKGGEIVAEGPPDSLGGRAAMKTRIRFRLPAGTTDTPRLGETPLPDGSFEISADDATRATHELTGWALERGLSFESPRGHEAVPGGRLPRADGWRGGRRMSDLGLLAAPGGQHE